jgi:indolepyruvate ferredoxin oxidoreductase
MEQEIRDAVGPESVDFIDATRLALGLMGDSIATNLFIVGYAYQKGLLPVSEASILRSIELNGATVESNKKSFHWGRLAAVDRARVTAAATPQQAAPASQRISESLDEMIARRVTFLTAYQDAAYARRYSDLVALVRQTETARMPGSTALTEAVARYWFKLLAVKDEYEVARLYTDGEFRKRLAAQFEGDTTLKFHLAPPLWVKPDPVTGQVAKREYGPWMMKAFGLLAGMKRFRGTAFDVFAHSTERKLERQRIKDYAVLMDEVLAKLAPHNHALAVELASIPEEIRGFGHVKERHVKLAKAKEAEVLARFREAQRKISVVAAKAAA